MFKPAKKMPEGFTIVDYFSKYYIDNLIEEFKALTGSTEDLSERWLAVIDDETKAPVGFVRAASGPGPRYPLAAIYITPAYRRKGLGTALLQSLLFHSPGLELEIYVHKENKEFTKFLNSMRFGRYAVIHAWVYHCDMKSQTEAIKARENYEELKALPQTIIWSEDFSEVTVQGTLTVKQLHTLTEFTKYAERQYQDDKYREKQNDQ